jgi:hypothetical protein
MAQLGDVAAQLRNVAAKLRDVAGNVVTQLVKANEFFLTSEVKSFVEMFFYT